MPKAQRMAHRTGGDVTTTQHAPTPLLDVLTQHQRRVIQDALTEASSDYWNRRAAQFEAARPQPGDYTGHATAEALESRDRRCAATAEACRARAQVSDVLWAGERRILDEAGL